MQPLDHDSLRDVNIGDRVRLRGNGVNELFQATSRIGKAQYFVSLHFGYEYTRPQLCDKYMRDLCEFEIHGIPESGWRNPE